MCHKFVRECSKATVIVNSMWMGCCTRRVYAIFFLFIKPHHAALTLLAMILYFKASGSTLQHNYYTMYPFLGLLENDVLKMLFKLICELASGPLFQQGALLYIATTNVVKMNHFITKIFSNFCISYALSNERNLPIFYSY